MAIASSKGKSKSGITLPEPDDFSDLFCTNDPTDSTNVMLVGAPNTRKTYSLNTVPDTWVDWRTGEERDFRVLYLNADDRAVVIDKKKRARWKTINLPMVFSDPQQIISRHDRVLSMIQEGYNFRDGYNEQFDAVIYDSLTPLNENIFNFTWSEVKSKTGDDSWGRGYEDNEARYGTLEHYLKRFVLGLRDNTQFCWIIAHEKEPHFQDKKPVYRPDLSGGIKNVLPRFFHEMYYTMQHMGEWCWLTQKHGQREPRTCYPIQKFIPMDWSIIVNRRWDEFYDPDVAFDAEQAKEEAAEKERAEIDKAMEGTQ